MARLIKIHLFIIILIILDQISKNYLISYFSYGGVSVDILPILQITESWNYGISFGLLRQYEVYGNYFLMLLNSCIVVYLYYICLKTSQFTILAGLLFIIGGAAGNICDRFVHGAVFDFILFHYQDYYFPNFNLADSFITIGALILLYGYGKAE